MTREEFEAVIAIEGKYLEVRPTITRAGVWWNAVVWNWQDVYPYHVELQRLVFGVPVGDTPRIQRVQRSIATVRGASTNRKAVKYMIEHWEKGDF